MNLGYAKQAVWIDTDPACGHAKTDDVDDCWALFLALRSNEMDIRGISTVFGNGSGEKSNASKRMGVFKLYGPKARPPYMSDNQFAGYFVTAKC